MTETPIVVEIPQAAYDAGREALSQDAELVDHVGAAVLKDCAGVVTDLVLHAVVPIALAAAYTALADELTELAEHMRKNPGLSGWGGLRAAGLVEGITMIRQRAAQLRGDE